MYRRLLFVILGLLSFVGAAIVLSLATGLGSSPPLAPDQATASGFVPLPTLPRPPTTSAPAPATAAPPASPSPSAAVTGETPIYTYTVVRAYPHDRAAFTQGLVYENGRLYEGTGQYGQSELRRVELETGAVLQQQPIDAEYFGEGITIWRDRIIQLTWQERTGFVYDRDTFELLRDFTYPMEGWGITHDASRLILSDGTATLHFWDPETLTETGTLEVHDNGVPVTNLNELEYIRGEIYANVWQTDRIARIDPVTGRVLAWIDLTGLLSAEDLSQPVDVLNGIAYDADNDRLFVTGKWWPRLFEIDLVGQTFLPLVLMSGRRGKAPLFLSRTGS